MLESTFKEPVDCEMIFDHNISQNYGCSNKIY